MPKISPLTASIALIVLTMVVAAALASYVTGIVAQRQAALSECPSGSALNYVSNDYPRWSGGRIIAIIGANVPLDDFAFSVALNNGSVLTLGDSNKLVLSQGVPGEIRTEQLSVSSSDVASVAILSNCTNVKSEARALR